MKVGVCGAGGRMGKAVLRIALERGYEISAAFDKNYESFTAGININSNLIKITSLNSEEVKLCDGLIDFSLPGNVLDLLQLARENKKPLVIGTTGFSNQEEKIIKEVSAEIPLLFSANMSLGVNFLFKLTELAAQIVDDRYDLEVFEAHHRLKKDSPSGTAKKLIQILKDNRSDLKEATEIHGREGNDLSRSNQEIGVMAVRGGDITGEHTVFFIGEGERLELTHRATNRDVFAQGAVRALEFLVGQKPGLYTMYDVLGL